MKAKYLYIISALTLGFVACQQGAYEAELATNGEMRFNVTAGTRVANDEFEAEDKVGLYVTDYVDSETPAPLQVSGNRANNEAITFDGTKWNIERPIYWGEGKSDVYAYYPYTAEIANVDEMPFSVATDQNTEGAYEASDLLWAKAAGVQRTGGAVSLAMKHAMSRLVVKIVAGEDYIGSLPVDATVHLHSTVTDARVTLSTGSVVKNPYAGAASIKMHNLGLRTFAEGKAVVYEAIVVPQMLETSVPLLEINAKSVSYLLEDSFNFKPGTSYTYTAVLNESTTAIKVEIGCEIEDWNNIGGDSGDDDGGEGGEGGNEGGIDLSLYTDLSAEGTANCYLVQAAGNYKFKAAVGNSDVTVGNVKKSEVLWETFGTDVMPNVGDLIASVGYQNGYVYFSTPAEFKNGNASIAVRSSKDAILWSWHIWCSEEGWTDHVYANNAGTMMDRNLGATSATPGEVGAFGLFYQWGRKDPFMGKGSRSNSYLAASTGSWNTVSGSKSVLYTEENPTTFISERNWCTRTINSESDYVFFWQENKKSMYDPCPAGYRIPNSDFWTTSHINISGDSTNYGIHWTLADGQTTAWYPAIGYRYHSSSSVGYTGTSSHYWTAFSEMGVSSWHSSAMSVIGTSNYSMYIIERGNGCSVRCVKE